MSNQSLINIIQQIHTNVDSIKDMIDNDDITIKPNKRVTLKNNNYELLCKLEQINNQLENIMYDKHPLPIIDGKSMFNNIFFDDKDSDLPDNIFAKIM
jgi:hypothetical protein